MREAVLEVKIDVELEVDDAPEDEFFVALEVEVVLLLEAVHVVEQDADLAGDLDDELVVDGLLVAEVVVFDELAVDLERLEHEHQLGGLVELVVEHVLEVVLQDLQDLALLLHVRLQEAEQLVHRHLLPVDLLHLPLDLLLDLQHVAQAVVKRYPEFRFIFILQIPVVEREAPHAQLLRLLHDLLVRHLPVGFQETHLLDLQDLLLPVFIDVEKCQVIEQV